MKKQSVKILLLLVYMTILGCEHKSITKKGCDFEKSFISINSFSKIQNLCKSDPPHYNCNPSLPAISYDSLKSFSQIDSLRAQICKQNLVDMIGSIPLKYVFNNDTILLAAFPVSCNCCIDIFIDNQIIIKVTDKKITINEITISNDIGELYLKDTLCTIFSNKFNSYFASQYQIKEKVADTTKIKRLAGKNFRRYSWLIRFEIQDDNQWKKIKKPLDIILTAYLTGLKNSLKYNYKKELCDLSSFELRLFSNILFLNFEFSKIKE